MTYTLTFEPEALKALGRFYGFSLLLEGEVQEALHLGGQLLVQKAQEKTWEVFEHPTGELEKQIEEVRVSSSEVHVVSQAIYSQRRERGFSGMTDSLGRTYTDDPAKPFMLPTLEEHSHEVLLLMDVGIARALQRLAKG